MLGLLDEPHALAALLCAEHVASFGAHLCTFPLIAVSICHLGRVRVDYLMKFSPEQLEILITGLCVGNIR